MKLIIPGGSGQVGTLLARAFVEQGHEVVVLSRLPRPAAWRVVPWDGATLGTWQREFEGADAVVNLAGRSVNCRYTRRHRREILDSRILSTRVVGRAIAQTSDPPRVWLQASTATIYAHRYDAPNDELSGMLGGAESNAPSSWRFSIDVARAWEEAFNEAALAATRKVLLRSAMTMSPDRGGVFDALLQLVRVGLGGTIGDGRQYMSWIHEFDFVRAVEWLIARDDLAGVFNLASPHPVPNAEFMRALRHAWGIRFGMAASRPLLEIATWLMRSESELVLKSRRVVPRRLLESGFEFQLPLWSDAALELCQRYRHWISATHRLARSRSVAVCRP
ncbi:MAG TPA: TIGR01777 family oxidoreductase [Pirellulales bacterium]|nr:TIGR01777 family oxidoreductase [Pirellulales bacterium]